MANSLPNLVGTEKQILWASDIRESAMANYMRIAESKGRAAIVNHDAVTEAFSLCSDAKSWIDNRDNCTSFVVRELNRWVGCSGDDDEYDRRELICNRFTRPL